MKLYLKLLLSVLVVDLVVFVPYIVGVGIYFLHGFNMDDRPVLLIWCMGFVGSVVVGFIIQVLVRWIDWLKE